MTDQVHGTEWALVLADWKRANAVVTVHLRRGVSLGPGKVTRLPGGVLDAAEIHDTRHPETKWTFDLSEVAAITAEAPR